MLEARREQAGTRWYTWGRAARRWVAVFLVALDAVAIVLALAGAYWLRYGIKLGPAIRDRVDFSVYEPLAFLLLVVMLSVLFAKGAYRLRLATEVVDEVVMVFSAATLTVGAIVVITAMVNKYVYSRGMIVYLWLLLIVAVAGARALFRAGQAMSYRKGLGVRRLAVVGDTDAGKLVMQSVAGRPELGYDLVGFIDHGDVPQPRDFGRFRVLGRISDLPRVLDQHDIDEIIIAVPAAAHADVWPVLGSCEERGVLVKMVPDLFDVSLGRVSVDTLAGIPVFGIQDHPLRGFALGAKRACDIFVSLALLIISLPLLGVLALLIRLESAGPIILAQDRIGKGGRSFGCLKLRTMRPDAEELQPQLLPMNEADGPLFKIRDDPRLTRFGRHIRRWSLDEIPQLWNVVVGEMSLVGPRPPLPAEVARYEPAHMRRLEAKPGLTGIWQVSGRADLPFDEMVLMDIFYVDNWSLALDVKILVRTVKAVLFRRGAY